MSLKLNLILNKTKNNVIGIDNKLLFKIKDDLLFFKNITSSTDDKKNIIIMGFNTWVSIPNKPLENRINIISKDLRINTKVRKLSVNFSFSCFQGILDQGNNGHWSNTTWNRSDLACFFAYFIKCNITDQFES